MPPTPHVIPGESEVDKLELCLWELVRGSQRAEARTRRHVTGIELLILVDGEVSSASPFRTADVAVMEATVANVRHCLREDGWVDAGPRPA